MVEAGTNRSVVPLAAVIADRSFSAGARGKKRPPQPIRCSSIVLVSAKKRAIHVRATQLGLCKRRLRRRVRSCRRPLVGGLVGGLAAFGARRWLAPPRAAQPRAIRDIFGGEREAMWLEYVVLALQAVWERHAGRVPAPYRTAIAAARTSAIRACAVHYTLGLRGARGATGARRASKGEMAGQRHPCRAGGGRRQRQVQHRGRRAGAGAARERWRRQ